MHKQNAPLRKVRYSRGPHCPEAEESGCELVANETACTAIHVSPFCFLVILLVWKSTQNLEGSTSMPPVQTARLQPMCSTMPQSTGGRSVLHTCKVPGPGLCMSQSLSTTPKVGLTPLPRAEKIRTCPKPFTQQMKGAGSEPRRPGSKFALKH